MVYGEDYDGISSSSIPLLSFFINENTLGKCFRSGSSLSKGEGTPVLNKCQNIRVAKK